MQSSLPFLTYHQPALWQRITDEFFIQAAISLTIGVHYRHLTTSSILDVIPTDCGYIDIKSNPLTKQ